MLTECVRAGRQRRVMLAAAHEPIREPYDHRHGRVCSLPCWPGLPWRRRRPARSTTCSQPTRRLRRAPPTSASTPPSSSTSRADGVLFRPEAVPAQDWLATHEPAPRPTRMVAAGGGRRLHRALAISSGPWRYSNAAGGEPVAGHYLSVWRRDADGHWRVVLDHGIDHAVAVPAEPLAMAFANLWRSAADGKCSGRSDDRTLRRPSGTERWRESRRTHAGPATRRGRRRAAYRDDAAPARRHATGPRRTRASQRAPWRSPPAWSSIPTPTSRATYGVLQSAERRHARAVRARVERERRRWRVAVDLQAPLPPVACRLGSALSASISAGVRPAVREHFVGVLAERGARPRRQRSPSSLIGFASTRKSGRAG